MADEDFRSLEKHFTNEDPIETLRLCIAKLRAGKVAFRDLSFFEATLLAGEGYVKGFKFLKENYKNFKSENKKFNETIRNANCWEEMGYIEGRLGDSSHSLVELIKTVGVEGHSFDYIQEEMRISPAFLEEGLRRYSDLFRVEAGTSGQFVFLSPKGLARFSRMMPLAPFSNIDCYNVHISCDLQYVGPNNGLVPALFRFGKSRYSSEDGHYSGRGTDLMEELHSLLYRHVGGLISSEKIIDPEQHFHITSRFEGILDLIFKLAFHEGRAENEVSAILPENYKLKDTLKIHQFSEGDGTRYDTATIGYVITHLNGLLVCKLYAKPQTDEVAKRVRQRFIKSAIDTAATWVAWEPR